MKSPVLENCTPGSVRGAPGNRRPYRDNHGGQKDSLLFLMILPNTILSAQGSVVVARA